MFDAVPQALIPNRPERLLERVEDNPVAAIADGVDRGLVAPGEYRGDLPVQLLRGEPQQTTGGGIVAVRL
jgi:hypothetical protein